MNNSRSEIKKLSELGKNEKGRVVGLSNEPEIRNRLQNMGLATGSVVEILAGSSNSNYLVSIGNTRIGLELNLADAITVQKL